MSEEQVLNTLHKHVPEKAVQYCFLLWKEKPFTLKLAKSRQTKIGDFTCRNNTTHPRITLNHDLSPFTFLITYLHEVAHLHVFLQFGHRAAPHGEHWKKAFQKLLGPVLNREIFPDTILNPLIRHMQNPKASSFADAVLTKALRALDENSQHVMVLSDLPEGSSFQLHGRYFTKGILRRTRILCKEVKSKRQYLVPADAVVSDVQFSLL